MSATRLCRGLVKNRESMVALCAAVVVGTNVPAEPGCGGWVTRIDVAESSLFCNE